MKFVGTKEKCCRFQYRGGLDLQTVNASFAVQSPLLLSDADNISIISLHQNTRKTTTLANVCQHNCNNMWSTDDVDRIQGFKQQNTTTYVKG